MIMAKQTFLEELDEIDRGDELPLSNRMFARVMRHFCNNHMAHLDKKVDTVKEEQKSQRMILFKVVLPMLLLILAAIVGLAIRGG